MNNEATISACIENAFAAKSNGDMDSAFDYLARALGCSDWQAGELATIDAAYAAIKA